MDMETVVALMTENMVPIALACGGLLLVLLLWWTTILLTKLSARKAARLTSIPPGLTVTAQPFISKSEAAFYNVLRLAVQDEYLLFAQVPVWALIDVSADQPQLRLDFLGQIALKRVDFVLVHPGTLAVVKVIELEDSSPSDARHMRNQLVGKTLHAAGIELLRLPIDRSYSIAELASALDIESAE